VPIRQDSQSFEERQKRIWEDMHERMERRRREWDDEVRTSVYIGVQCTLAYCYVCQVKVVMAYTRYYIVIYAVLRY